MNTVKRIADKRRKVVYEEKKSNWDLMKQVGKENHLTPSSIIRAAVHQMCQKIRNNPKIRFVSPIFDEQPQKPFTSETKEKKFRIFCPKCDSDHRVPPSSIGSKMKCKDCPHTFVVTEHLRRKQ